MFLDIVVPEEETKMAKELRDYEFNCFIDKVNSLINDKKFVEAKVSFDNNTFTVTIFINNLYWLDIIKHKDPVDNHWAFTVKVWCIGATSNRLLLKQTIHRQEELQPAPFAYTEVSETFYNAFAAVTEDDALKAFLN